MYINNKYAYSQIELQADESDSGWVDIVTLKSRPFIVGTFNGLLMINTFYSVSRI